VSPFESGTGVTCILGEGMVAVGATEVAMVGFVLEGFVVGAGLGSLLVTTGRACRFCS